MSDTMQSLGLKSYEMSVSINQAQRAFSELLRTCLGHHGLTIPEWSLLGNLYKTGAPVRPIIVSKSLGIKPPYIAKLINLLEPQGLIACQAFPDDDRGKTIVITEKGKQLVESVELKLEECLNHQLSNLRQDELKVYFALTNYIAKHVHHDN